MNFKTFIPGSKVRQLEAENQRLKTELDRLRVENDSLSSKNISLNRQIEMLEMEMSEGCLFGDEEF